MKRAWIIAALFLLAGCSDYDGARRVLEQQGLSEVNITGYRMWGCSSDDEVHTGFEAKNIKGQKVSGIVCNGWGWFGKGYTVRFD